MDSQMHDPNMDNPRMDPREGFQDTPSPEDLKEYENWLDELAAKEEKESKETLPKN